MIQHMRKSRWLGVLGVTVVLALFAAAIVSAQGTDGTANGVIELDGDIANSGATTNGAASDWGPGSQSGSICVASTGVDINGDGVINGNDGIKVSPTLPANITAADCLGDSVNPDFSYFASNKDTENLSDWGCTKVNNPTPKDEILNGYAAQGVISGGLNNGDTALFAGFERGTNNGTSFQGVWFLAADIGCTAPANGSADFTGGDHEAWVCTVFFTNCTETGDLLLLINFTGGGSTPTALLFAWVGGNLGDDDTLVGAAGFSPNGPLQLVTPAGAGGCTGANTGTDICATTNDTSCVVTTWVPANQASCTTGGTGPRAPQIDKLQFFEGMLNLSDIFNPTGTGTVPCFSNVLFEARTSAQTSATLKDYILGDFDTCNADIEVTKEPDGGEVDAGNDAVFTIHVVNNGPDQAENVTLEDDLPPGDGLDWSITDQPAGDPCEITGAVGTQTLTCDFGDMDDGDSFDIEITSETGSADCGLQNNEVTIDSDTLDLITANNEDTGDITVNCPDVVVVKTPDEGTDPNNDINVGSTAQFKIVVTNNGPGQSDSVTLSDQLPTTGSLNWSIFSQGAGASGTGLTECTLSASDLLECDFGIMEEGDAYNIVLRSATTVADCGEINNTVTITPDGDILASNNTDTGNIDVLCAAIVILKNSTKGTAVTAAGTIFSVEGPTDADDFTVTDNGTNDEDSDIGQVCVSGLTVGNYTITETTPPAGYAQGATPADNVAAAEAGTHCGSTANASGENVDSDGTVTFVNPPEFDIRVQFRDGGSGETSLMEAISCTNVSTGSSTTPADANWDATLLVEGVDVPPAGEITLVCTIKVDP